MSKETGSSLSAVFLAVVRCEIKLGAKCTIKHSIDKLDGLPAVVVGFYPTGSETPVSVDLRILTGSLKDEIILDVNTANLQFDGTFKAVEVEPKELALS